MEADWEIEVGGEAPIIDAYWAGLIDLRARPEQAKHLPEAAEFPPLAETLMRLNARSARIWTAKCDVWRVDEFDPDELEASSDAALHGVACYIDLLPAGNDQWLNLEAAADWCKQVSGALHGQVLKQARADLVLRRALLRDDQWRFGCTVYFQGCGKTEPEAFAVLASVLMLFADVVSSDFPERDLHSYNGEQRASSSIG